MHNYLKDDISVSNKEGRPDRYRRSAHPNGNHTEVSSEASRVRTGLGKYLPQQANSKMDVRAT